MNTSLLLKNGGKIHCQAIRCWCLTVKVMAVIFSGGLIENGISFVTWDKYVDTAALAKLSPEFFSEEITVNGKKYNLFEGEKEFTYTIAQPDCNEGESKQKVTFAIRRIYIWNRNSNRRACGLAWTGDMDISTADCARAILNRWGASENTFKHLNDRHPFHYHPGFKLKVSEKQGISNPEIKDLSCEISKLRKIIAKLLQKLAKAKDIFNKNGHLRKNGSKEKIKEKISTLELEIIANKQAKDALPEKVDVSKLEDYESFQRIDNEGKNLFDFVTSSVWNVRKQMGSSTWLNNRFLLRRLNIMHRHSNSDCHQRHRSPS